MANLKEVRTRIASVSSTQQITSAMKMVSAAKFRRAQNAIFGMRPYTAKLQEIIGDINTEDGVQTPYHEIRKPDNVLLLVVTSNKGLCGAFNSNVIKEAAARVKYYTDLSVSNLQMITLGKRNILIENDGWTARTIDRKPAAHYELSVCVRNGKADILSTFDYIQEVLGDKFI